MRSVAPIRPELLAAKFEKIENFEQQRLLEEFAERPELPRLLCYLQHISQSQNYPGGLAKFAADLVAATDLIGTPTMLNAKGTARRYAIHEAIAILHELPEHVVLSLLGDDEWIIVNVFKSGRPLEDHVNVTRERELSLGDIARPFSEDEEQPEKWEGPRVRAEGRLLHLLTPERTLACCREAALEGLADYLKQVCELPHVRLLPGEHGAPWYFPRIADALLAFTEKRAQTLRSQIAETEVTNLIDKWLGKSLRMRQTVMIVGNSRFGKTEKFEYKAAAHPGHCRLIRTPPGNDLTSLLRRVAEPLGIETGPHVTGRALAEKIDYVLHFLNLQLIFDEAQNLLPATYSRNSSPARLNWFRDAIMDRHVPAALVCTPQSYLPAKSRFVKTTGFAMEQFDERIEKTVKLPEELSESDQLAVARIHFPDLSADYLQYVVNKIMATDRNYISDIAKIARHARDYAEENGRKRPILADINAAIADVLPVITAQPVAQSQVPVDSKRPRKSALRSRFAPAVQPRCNTGAEQPDRSAPESISRRKPQPLVSG